MRTTRKPHQNHRETSRDNNEGIEETLNERQKKCNRVFSSLRQVSKKCFLLLREKVQKEGDYFSNLIMDFV